MSKPKPPVMIETPRLKSWLKQGEPETQSKIEADAEYRVEAILNSRGWRTVNGRARYLGFEHELNPEIPVLTAVRK